jgi:tetratricopeptide (TPR) repeat protein
VSVYRPHLERDQILAGLRSNDQTNASQILTAAAQAVPGDQMGWLQLAHLHRQRSATGGAEARAHYHAAEVALQKAIDLEPARASNYLRLADLYDLAGRQKLDESAAEKQIAAWRAALGRYPHHAVRRFEFAEVLAGAGKRDEAMREYRQALMLDQTPHPDKKLTEQQRQEAREALRNAGSGGAALESKSTGRLGWRENSTLLSPRTR